MCDHHVFLNLETLKVSLGGAVVSRDPARAATALFVYVPVPQALDESDLRLKHSGVLLCFGRLDRVLPCLLRYRFAVLLPPR